MERWEKPPAPRRPAAVAVREKPSFSSTLLDSIYRSIDDEAASGGAKRAHRRDPFPPPPPPEKRRPDRPILVANSTSSSSDCSSYGGFSSSEPESARIRIRPIRTTALPPIPPPRGKKEVSTGRKSRDPKKPKPPASPGARLASFLNSLLSPRRKCRASVSAPAPAEPVVAPSCLSKAPSARERRRSPAREGKRSVRFYPVSVVVDDECRPCAHVRINCGETAARGPAIAAARRRGAEVEDGGESDSSSDLFELENLTAVGGGRYRDELPVYESTQLRAHRQGFMV